MSRRARLLCLRALLLAALTVSAGAAELLVHLPEVSSAAAVEQALRADPACADLRIRVVAKWRQLEEILAATPPDLVLARGAVERCAGWYPVLVGRGADHEAQPLQLLVLDAAPSSADGPLVLGVLQDRPVADLASWGQELLPGRSLRQVRPAARPDDVIGLLGLELAQVVAVSPAAASEAQRRFPGRIVVWGQTAPVPLARVFARHEPARALAEPLSRLHSETRARLGLPPLLPAQESHAPNPAATAAIGREGQP